MLPMLCEHVACHGPWLTWGTVRSLTAAGARLNAAVRPSLVAAHALGATRLRAVAEARDYRSLSEMVRVITHDVTLVGDAAFAARGAHQVPLEDINASHARRACLSWLTWETVRSLTASEDAGRLAAHRRARALDWPKARWAKATKSMSKVAHSSVAARSVAARSMAARSMTARSMVASLMATRSMAARAMAACSKVARSMAAHAQGQHVRWQFDRSQHARGQHARQQLAR